MTVEECQTALQSHGWNIQKAIEYLKVAWCMAAIVMITKSLFIFIRIN